ncbi:LamG-like jellyroll fold domain-containing protein [Streptosporangium sp. G11]|uniref:LamG-like jellyroll fold domain-containing protein n=1 Tax=Streptosporangium sp. G11 TaxID=3436926 RepID=UPI003EBE83F0
MIRTDQSFTVSAWLRWNDKDGTYTVIEQRGTEQAPFRLGNDSEQGLVFTFTDADDSGAVVEGVRSGSEAPADEWFLIAGSRNSHGNARRVKGRVSAVKRTPIYRGSLRGSPGTACSVASPPGCLVCPIQLRALSTAVLGHMQDIGRRSRPTTEAPPGRHAVNHWIHTCLHTNFRMTW